MALDLRYAVAMHLPLSRTLVVPILACVLALSACAESPEESAQASASAPASVEASSPAAESPASGAPSAPADGTNPDLPDLVEAATPSVVSVLRSDGGQGSGVIWSSDGVIVTNNHVIEGAPAVSVAFADGQRVEAEIVATDPRTDLAVLRADREDLPAATFTEDLPRVGELALAIGNPLGFENTATAGIVSGLHRSIPGAAEQAPALVDLIQTDAAISPGNSGGALVGSDGRVIGVNVAYLPPNPQGGRGAVSIGFAIPAPTVRDVVEQLLETGRAQHAYLGIRPVTLTPALAEQFGSSRTAGVVVQSVAEGSPAAAAGLQPGDLLIAAGDRQLEVAEDLLTVLRDQSPGDVLSLTVVRNEGESEVEVTLADLPETPG